MEPFDPSTDDEPTRPAGQTLTRTALVGGSWATLTNVATRVLGAAKAIILARLLVPADFGLVGLALATVGTVNMLSNPGINTALIQRKDVDREDFNAGWWLHAMRGCLLFVLLLATADWLADFYGEPQLETLLWVISLTFLMDGFQSIGLVRLNRELNFRRLMWVQLSTNLVSFVTAVALAWSLRSLWALVGSHIAQLVTMLIMSYILEPFRPSLKIDWGRAKTLLKFGGFVFLALICYIILNRGNAFILGRMIGVERYGYYALALSLAGMLSGPIDQLISLVGLPALSRIQADRERLLGAFSRTFRTTMLLAAPGFIGLAIFGRDVVWLMLGSKWMPMVGPLIWLCFLGWFRTLIQTFDSLNLAIGKPEIEVKLRGVELVLFAAGIVPAVRWYGASGAAAYLFLIYVISFLLHVWVTRWYFRGVSKAVVTIWVSFAPLFAGQALFGWFQWHQNGPSPGPSCWEACTPFSCSSFSGGKSENYWPPSWDRHSRGRRNETQ